MDEEYLDTYTSISFTFKTIRIVGNVISSFVNTLTSDIYVDEEVTELDINITLEKIHFWFDHIVSNAIMFGRDNTFAIDLMFNEQGVARTGNLPMVMPLDPTDDHLCSVFHSKLNALGNGVIQFGEMKIISDTREKLTNTFTGYGELNLPAMEEWVGERAYHDNPWWCRNDGSTLDVIPSDDADLADPPITGVDISFIENRYRRPEQEAAIIIRPEFKPEVISGGKDDKPKS